MFIATQWATAADKEKFVAAFKRFVQRGFPPSAFTKKMYQQMSMMRGHIAEYNQLGFYNVWFRAPASRAEFLNRWARSPVYGDPSHTWSDVERAIAFWLCEHPEYERSEVNAHVASGEVAERAELARLKAKYEPEPAHA